MRVVLDTNALVSGLFFMGIPYQILQGVKQRKYHMVITSDIVEEYKKTIDKLVHKFTHNNAYEQLNLFVVNSKICESQKLSQPVCADPDDDKFIACAIASKTKIIVSGDKHLLDISGYQNIQVLKPKEFLEKYP